MFNWFRPRCPVDPVEKAWVEKRMNWLADAVGLDRLRTAVVVLPTPEFFPDRYSGTDADVRPMLDRVCRYMGVEQDRLGLELYGDESESPAALGVYEQGPPERVLINRTQLAEPVSLVGTLAHEVAHALLLGDGRISRDATDHELVTDLLTVFLGMGVFGSNTVIRESYGRNTAISFTWSMGKQGYLSEKLYGYALALFAWARREPKPAWSQHLRPNVRAPFADGLDYLGGTSDSLFQPGTAFRIPDDTTGIQGLTSPSAACRIAALWDLQFLRAGAAGARDAVVRALRDSEALVRREAAVTLATIGPAAEAVTAVLDAARLEGHREVRQALAEAATRMQAKPEEIVPLLVHLVRQEPACCSTQSFQVAGEADVFPRQGYFAALQTYGAAAVAAVPVLIESLRDHELDAIEAARTLAAIGPAAAAAIPELLLALEGEAGALSAASAAALGAIGRDCAAVIPALRATLRPDWPGCDVRAEAAAALGRLGPAARPAVKDLERLLAAKDRDVRLHATVALAEVQGCTDDALRAFREALPPPLGIGRRRAGRLDTYAFVADSLPRLGAGAVQALAMTLAGSGRPDRPFAAWALGQCGPRAAAGLPALRAALADTVPLTRLLAAAAVWLVDRDAATVVPALLGEWQSLGIAAKGRPANALSVYRVWVPQALHAMGAPAAPVLVQALPELRTEVRGELVRLLAGLALQSPAVRRILEADSGGPALEVLREQAALAEAVRGERFRRLSFPPPLPDADPEDAFLAVVRQFVEALGGTFSNGLFFCRGSGQLKGAQLQ